MAVALLNKIKDRLAALAKEHKAAHAAGNKKKADSIMRQMEKLQATANAVRANPQKAAEMYKGIQEGRNPKVRGKPKPKPGAPKDTGVQRRETESAASLQAGSTAPKKTGQTQKIMGPPSPRDVKAAEARGSKTGPGQGPKTTEEAIRESLQKGRSKGETAYRGLETASTRQKAVSAASKASKPAKAAKPAKANTRPAKTAEEAKKPVKQPTRKPGARKGDEASGPTRKNKTAPKSKAPKADKTGPTRQNKKPAKKTAPKADKTGPTRQNKTTATNKAAEAKRKTNINKRRAIGGMGGLALATAAGLTYNKMNKEDRGSIKVEPSKSSSSSTASKPESKKTTKPVRTAGPSGKRAQMGSRTSATTGRTKAPSKDKPAKTESKSKREIKKSYGELKWGDEGSVEQVRYTRKKKKEKKKD